MTIQIQKDVEFWGAYFQGVQDIVKPRSCTQVFIGLCKVLSYLTVISPIIIRCIYIYNADALKNLKDLSGRVSKIVERGSPTEIKTISDDEYFQYLVIQFKDNEKDKFLKAFEKSTLVAQEWFFKQMTEEGRLIEALETLPKTLTKLSVDFGKFNGNTISQAKCFLEKITHLTHRN